MYVVKDLKNLVGRSYKREFFLLAGFVLSGALAFLFFTAASESSDSEETEQGLTSRFRRWLQAPPCGIYCYGIPPGGVTTYTPPRACCGLTDCFKNKNGGYSCLDHSLPEKYLEPYSNTFVVVYCDTFPTRGLTSDCGCLVGTGEFSQGYNVDDLCNSCTIVRGGGEDYSIAFDCSDELLGSCVGLDSSGNCISTACCGLSDCFNNNAGGVSCLDHSLPEEYLVPYTNTFVMVYCDSLPTRGLTPDCGCYVGTGNFGPDYDTEDLCTSCSLTPGNQGDYSIAFDCSDEITGGCVGLDSSGNCISNPCCGLTDCFENAAGGVSCLDHSLPEEYLAPYINTFVMVSCPSRPEAGKGLAADCICLVGTGEFGPDYDVEDLCKSCTILRAQDDSYAIAFDCSDEITGSCVGLDASGKCISNLP